MINLAVNGYSAADVAAQLHGRSGSRLVRYRFDLLNRDDVEIGNVAADRGSRVSLSSLADIKRTAQFVLPDSEARDIDFLNDRLRPVFCLRMPDGGWAEWPLGVFLLSSPSRVSTGTGISRSIEAYDASLILLEDKFDVRYRIAAGTRYTDAVSNILAGAGIWKVALTAHPGSIFSDKEFEVGTSKLTAINELLTEINYSSIWVDEHGYFVARPYAIPTDREAEYAYRNDQLSIIRPGVAEELDLFAVPNKWVVVASNPEKQPIVARHTNDLITSITSTVNRGRAIVNYRQINDVLDQQTLNDYVRRIAYEASQVYGKVVFDTAAMPHHSYLDMIFVEHSDLAVSGKYTETNWTLELYAGGKMTHTARRVIHI